MAGLLAGLPIEIPGATVNRLCGSGMQAVVSAAHALDDGWGHVMIAGGSESMSRAPYVISKPEKGFATGLPDSADTVLGWRLVNPEMERLYPPITLGMTAEVVAEKYDVSREDQDGFALASHRKALAAVEAGRFDDEIEPIDAPTDPRRRSTVSIVHDEGPRADTSLEVLAGLRPVFKEGGTVTAGNSSPMNDGAAALLLATEVGLGQHGLTPMARIVSSGAAGVHPDVMGIGPVPASEKALERAGITTDDLDLVELNEAFASQSLASMSLLDLDPEKVNVNGGAIAIGHPLGASGARLLVTLVHELVKSGKRYGLATMCIGVGQGISTVIERV
jgi:acetyl-CoA C-acetyltransferase/3-oxo-5,6-didehydrosuberyl-CoA/3-oxoadipyl-CoA thiolase